MLDNQSPTSLYEQVKLLVKQDVIDGVYEDGERIPSELELCDMYGVSRVTVRRALSELSDEGFLVIRHGRGTFAQRPRMDMKILGMAGFGELAEKYHHPLEKRILQKEMVAAPKKVSDALEIDEGTEVLKLKRLIIEQDKPLSVDTAYFSPEVFPGISEFITDGVSTFDIMTDDYSIDVKSAYKEFEVVVATPKIADSLLCSIGDPLFLVTKTIYAANKQPIHFSFYYILTSKVKYSLVVDLSSEELRKGK